MSKTDRAEQLRILHLEDDPGDTEMVRLALEEEKIHCDLHRVQTKQDFETALKRGNWGLIISDFSLPSFDGMKALKMTREKCPEVPFILFSGTIGEETAVESLKKGAADYILKQRPERLILAVRHILKQAEEHQHALKIQEELRRSAEREKQMEARFLRMQRMESIGALVSGIAHDLNNALVPVLMGVGFLRTEPLNEESQNVLNVIESSARRGADMLKQVLAFARGAEGRKSPVQVKFLLHEMEKIIRETFPKTIRLQISSTTDLWPVSGYPTQLHQILMNLCINARDAMPGGGQLTLSAENVSLDETCPQIHPDAAPGSYLLVTISDTGSGISTEVLEKLFQPFFTTKDPGKGTGLGLSTSLNIVKTHGGFITVESKVGRGTNFNVYLPALHAGTDPDAGAEPRLAGLPTGSGEYILIVDDEAAICEITKASLENYGYNVLTAAGGPEAVVILAEKRDQIVLVLTDADMPYMDGHATCLALKKINSDLKIIMASGSTQTTEQEDAIARGSVNAFVPKPYTVEKLLNAVHEVLTQSDTKS